MLVSGAVAGFAETAPVRLYAEDSDHLWNRLHSALMTRGASGKALPADLLDPPGEVFSGDGTVCRETAALLGEFVRDAAPGASQPPLQRAVMQRDLLALYLALAREGAVEQTWTTGERELLAALALAVQRVALSAEEILALPDSYALAVAAVLSPRGDDAAGAGPFLPGDLFAADGPWILLDPAGKSGDPPAPFHFEIFGGCSIFEVLMRHPDGRTAGAAYLETLREMPAPWVYEKSPEADRLKPNGPDRVPWPNPATPQFPSGTAWALVRRAVLADGSGRPVLSPLVESVQIRVYRTLSMEEAGKAPALEELAKTLETTGHPDDYEDALAAEFQTAFEWEMRRTLLFEGGGFHLTMPEELKFAHFAPVVTSRPVTSHCLQCHFAAGIHSVQSRAGIFADLLARPPSLRPAMRESTDALSLRALQRHPGWVLLKWMYQDAAGK